MRNGKAVTLLIGKKHERSEITRQSGAPVCANELVRDSSDAHEREDGMVNNVMRRKISDSVSDSRPDIPANQVFQRLREKNGHTIALL